MMTDDQIKEQLRSSSSEFRELEETHHRLELELQEMLKHPNLTPQEEALKKQIQKEKLGKKDMMAECIRRYRETHNQAAV